MQALMTHSQPLLPARRGRRRLGGRGQDRLRADPADRRRRLPSTSIAVNPKAQGALRRAGLRAGRRRSARRLTWPSIASPAATVPGVLEECGQAGHPGSRRDHLVRLLRDGQPGRRGRDQAHRAPVRHPRRRAELRRDRQHASQAVRVDGDAPAGGRGGLHLAERRAGRGGALVGRRAGAGLQQVRQLRQPRRPGRDRPAALPGARTRRRGSSRCTSRASATAGGSWTRCGRSRACKPLVVIKSGRSRVRASARRCRTPARWPAPMRSTTPRCGRAARSGWTGRRGDVRPVQGLRELPPVKGRRRRHRHQLRRAGRAGGRPGRRRSGWRSRSRARGLRERLAERLPAHCALKNPIDLTVEGTEAGYRETLRPLLEEYDAALALDVSTPFLDSVALARGVCDAAERSGQADRRQLHGGAHRRRRDRLPGRSGASPNFATGERAVAVLARMAAVRSLPLSQPAGPGPSVPGRSREDCLSGGGRMLEPEAMALAARERHPDARVPVGGHRREACLNGCREIGYPVVDEGRLARHPAQVGVRRRRAERARRRRRRRRLRGDRSTPRTARTFAASSSIR